MQTSSLDNIEQHPSKFRFPKIQTKTRALTAEKKNNNFFQEITAKSWIYATNGTYFGYRTNVKRQIASLTKIMTCLCAIQLCQKYNINKSATYFKITEWASNLIGTSANLTQNAWVTVQDLLYGMMLPSGNDAATVLAQNLGAVLYFDKSGNKSLIQCIRSIDLTEDWSSIRFYMFQFIAYMNQKCQQLKMSRTRFANSHGMDMLNNYSCCQDLIKLTQQSMKSQQFKKIVKTQTYKASLKYFRDGKVICRSIYWNNTNKLLQKSNVTGIKTGITTKAGGCLSTSFITNDGQDGFIIVLGSYSTQDRFKDTLRIMKWVDDQLA